MTLVFSISDLKKWIEEDNKDFPGDPIVLKKKSLIFLSGVLEYMAAEILELAQVKVESGDNVINSNHVKEAITSDVELEKQYKYMKDRLPEYELKAKDRKFALEELLEQIAAPNTVMTENAFNLVNLMIHDVLTRIEWRVRFHPSLFNIEGLEPEVRSVLVGELGKHAVQEGHRVLNFITIAKLMKREK